FQRVIDEVEPLDAAAVDRVLWVHATLVRTALAVHERYGRAPSAAERAEYYAQSKAFAVAFRVPAGRIPPTWADFEDYWAAMLPRLAVPPEVLDVGRALLAPRLVPPVPGGLPLLRAVTADLLPEPVRAGYGLALGPAQRAQLRAFAAVGRHLVPRAPRRAREFPIVQRCRDRVAAGAGAPAAGTAQSTWRR
ncbi:oxygenase MpaB family protein, partial [Kineococcus glutinatus]|uniref:oxygenase MpaB family protein n=1 Tax=Kineococcus glutinatus TaxID=1070872 RepID=UPI0031E92DF5